MVKYTFLQCLFLLEKMTKTQKAMWKNQLSVTVSVIKLSPHCIKNLSIHVKRDAYLTYWKITVFNWTVVYRTTRENTSCDSSWDQNEWNRYPSQKVARSNICYHNEVYYVHNSHYYRAAIYDLSYVYTHLTLLTWSAKVSWARKIKNQHDHGPLPASV